MIVLSCRVCHALHCSLSTTTPTTSASQTEMNKFGSLKIQKATTLGEVIELHIGYSMVDSAHGLWVAVGSLHLLLQWHLGAMDIANTNLSQVYLHEDDRTSYLRHTIFYVLFVLVNIFFLVLVQVVHLTPGVYGRQRFIAYRSLLSLLTRQTEKHRETPW